MSPTLLPRRQSRPRAFTLVELLVVIGIIALLVSILLPTLARARQQGQLIVCQSNIRQCGLAFINYATDNRGRIPGNKYFGPKYNLDWAGTFNDTYLANPSAYKHPIETSVLGKYMASEKILRCPIATDNQFFDYTFLVRLSGAKTNLTWKMSYPIKPAQYDSPRLYFPGIPLLIEEHDLFNQHDWPDGAFWYSDQFTTRHQGKASLLFLDGSVIAFAPPHGKYDNVAEDEDLQNNHFLLHVGSLTYNVQDSNASEWGWANKPW